MSQRLEAGITWKFICSPAQQLILSIGWDLTRGFRPEPLHVSSASSWLYGLVLRARPFWEREREISSGMCYHHFRGSLRYLTARTPLDSSPRGSDKDLPGSDQGKLDFISYWGGQGSGRPWHRNTVVAIFGKYNVLRSLYSTGYWFFQSFQDFVVSFFRLWGCVRRVCIL